MNHPDIASRLRLIMKNLDITQKEFAQLLGVTQPAVSNYLKGRVPPGAVLIKIAQAGAVSLEWLLSGEGNLDPPSVSEQRSAYHTAKILSEKIEKLPARQRRLICDLVDQLLELQVKEE